LRYGSILQRRLTQLECVIKVRNPDEEWGAIQAQALSQLSTEDLRTLRDIVEKQAAGIAVDDTPHICEVVARCNEVCDQARANQQTRATKAPRRF